MRSYDTPLFICYLRCYVRQYMFNHSQFYSMCLLFLSETEYVQSVYTYTEQCISSQILILYSWFRRRFGRQTFENYATEPQTFAITTFGGSITSWMNIVKRERKPNRFNKYILRIGYFVFPRTLFTAWLFWRCKCHI